MNEYLEPFERMLEDIAPPATVRAIEAGGDTAPMWSGFAASGFLDALVEESGGGVGLSLADIHPLWAALGCHAVPLPVGETMLARALLVGAGITPPEGPIALVCRAQGGATLVPFGLVSEHIVVEAEEALHLVEISGRNRTATGVAASLAAHVDLSGLTGSGFASPPPGGLRAIGAILRAALIAGAADRLVSMTAAYAAERIQFGKPIGRQQALQQNLAVMAEDVVAARIASQIGCAGSFPPGPAAAAAAKSVASAAAARIAATAHAVHGAIGISEEHDLQLFTRRLHEWRLSDGSEGYWNRQLGAERLGVDASSVDFVRANIAPFS